METKSACCTQIQKEETQKSNNPRWIVNQDRCAWCKKYTMEIESIDKTERGLQVNYVCTNEDCDKKERLGEVSYFSILHGGRSIELYEKFLNQQKGENSG